jgi:DNA ligase-1
MHADGHPPKLVGVQTPVVSTPLAQLVATSERVGATRARSEKVAALAETIRGFDPAESRQGVALLAGEPYQGKIGVGWATLAAVASRDDRSPGAGRALTIDDVDDAVNRLAACSGTGSSAARAEILGALFGRAGPAERDFLGRVLLGELRHGALEGVVLDAVAKAAGVPATLVRRAAMLAGDLPRTAVIALRDGAQGLAAVGLEPLHPVQPMLATTATSVADAMAACPGEVSVEWKLDGARVQAHRQGDDVRLFTRNLNDVTARLPGVAAVVAALPCRAVVLDGEVLGLAEDDERPDAFQDTMSRFGRHEATNDGAPDRLVVRFFDCLHLDGVDLIDRPLKERLDALTRVAGPWQAPGIRTADPSEAMAFAENALAAGHEGVMVKAAASAYEAGRRGKAWRKVKPVITLDLVVLGAEWGHGRRQGWLSNLHLGARDPDGGFGPPGGLVMVGKTFKGMTDGLLAWQTARFLELERERTAGAVMIRPEIVVEIAVDGAQSSTRYAGGAALRFARVKRYREDKSAMDADTIDAVRALIPRLVTSPSAAAREGREPRQGGD